MELTSALQYKLAGFDQVFHMQILPHDKLFSPKFKIHRRKNIFSDGRFTKETVIEDFNQHSCYYRGSLLSHNDSSVAVNICDGLVSYYTKLH